MRSSRRAPLAWPFVVLALLLYPAMGQATVWRTGERGPMRVLAEGERLYWLNYAGGSECELRSMVVDGDETPQTCAQLPGICAGVARDEQGLVVATSVALFSLDARGRATRRHSVEPPGWIIELQMVAGRALVRTPEGLFEQRGDAFISLETTRGAPIAGNDTHYFVARGPTILRCRWADQRCESAAEFDGMRIGALEVESGRLLFVAAAPRHSGGDGGVGWLQDGRVRWLARGAFAPTGLFVHRGQVFFSGNQGYLRSVPLDGGEVAEVTSVSVALLPGRVAPLAGRVFYPGGPHSDRIFHSPLAER